MTSYPVLNDATRDARIVGYATTPDEAAGIYMAAIRAEMDPEDYAGIIPPTFAHRQPATLAPELRADCPAGAFEPV
ncbi:hypothetical protein [Methylobrevis pamukkalensis]|uniref:Uncharacterized protein n=1 Tax=Methylobrevis pamukkalensis TaxID=1439726 RepID=A0A1E3GZW5_9HYPH|nr:hypothetical protein [Methylobrevis pamukkalensis]ODN69580.1 hypothetical protein A6302_03126 [Methylobrevis pamukkalensis]